ncbi:hypothetical protein GGX14DRAFT_647517 [Mycena pura]|uniref:Uncharacterized protein n=1 Tax=Mycena pura TaxID=153505 RepID=A0AAD6VDM9_9AGAR|nr:hypothetical protein GGX14DRAFT_647517 [Mycena pura]
MPVVLECPCKGSSGHDPYIEDEDAYASADQYEAKGRKKRIGTAGKPPKLGKRETRGAIEAQVKRMRDQQRKESEGALASQAVAVIKKKGIQNSDAAAASSKAGVSARYLKAAAPIDYRSPPTSPELGGLNEKHLVSTKPVYARSNKAGPGLLQRKNELIEVKDDSEDDSDAIKATRPVKSQTKKSQLTVNKKMAALSVAKTRKPRDTPRTSSMPGLVDNAGPSQAAGSGTLSFSPASSDDVKGMPAIFAAKWQRVVVPALYRALNASRTPMDVGLQGDVTISLVQSVIDEIFPANIYKVQWNTVVCSRAAARLIEFRSAIGAAGIEAVAAYIDNKPQLSDDYPEIARYARYATKRGGPALFQHPTPYQDIDIKKGHADYVKPRGFLESDLFIETVAPFIKNLDGRRPRGALALAAAAIERGWGAYRTGSYEAPAQFSKSSIGTAVEGYMGSIRRLSDDAWERILGACNEKTRQVIMIASDDEDECLDGHREDLYEPSSP